MMDNSKNPTGLCLASHSPRRRLLLESLGVPFFVRAAGPEVEETVQGLGRGEDAENVALDRARVKGQDVRDQLKSVAGLESCAVLSADTVVSLGSRILDKPENETQAREFLECLSGREHAVITGLWLWAGLREYATWRMTKVKFAELSGPQIEAYIRTGEPFDKAGGYGIQGLGATLVESIEGCYFNVVGLPLRDTSQLLSRAEISWTLDPRN